MEESILKFVRTCDPDCRFKAHAHQLTLTLRHTSKRPKIRDLNMHKFQVT